MTVEENIADDILRNVQAEYVREKDQEVSHFKEEIYERDEAIQELKSMLATKEMYEHMAETQSFPVEVGLGRGCLYGELPMMTTLMF